MQAPTPTTKDMVDDGALRALLATGRARDGASRVLHGCRSWLAFRFAAQTTGAALADLLGRNEMLTRRQRRPAPNALRCWL